MNEPRKLDPKYYEGSDEKPKLVATSRTAFSLMFWFGIILLAAAVLAILVGLGSDDDLTKAGGFAFAGGALELAVPLLVGAGIVAGLGRRVREGEPGHAEQRARETE